MEHLEPRRLLAFPELDLTFGRAGVAIPADGGNFLVVEELPGGTILAAGGFTDPAVARFNADGSPDTSFDGDGVLVLPQAEYGLIEDAAVAPDGKIVILRHVRDELTVFRFNADGTVDTGFGSGGSVTHTFSNTIVSRTIAVQEDGKIVVSFAAFTSAGNQAYLVRLNVDGSVDNGFRGGLANAQPLPRPVFFMDSLVVGADGKIYLSGYDSRPETSQTSLLRFNADGTSDNTFGDGGVVDLAAAGEQATSQIAIDAEGRVVVVSEFTRDVDIVVQCFTSSGAHDPTFGGGDGVTELADVGADANDAVALLIDGDSRITAVIELSVPSEDILLFRLDDDGSVDTTFGEGGTRRFDELIRPEAATFDDDGNLLVSGGGVARFAPSSPEVAIGGDGIVAVTGTPVADVITVRVAGDQVIVGRNGIDTAFAAADVKGLTFLRSDGGDTITVDVARPCTVNAGDGDDAITLADGGHLVDSAAGNDTITTGGGDDTIVAGAGDDVVITAGGRDLVNSDTDLTAESGDDSVITGGGNDTVFTGSGNDTVNAGAGNDFVRPWVDFFDTGSLFCRGGDGSDKIWGTLGRDTLYGGAGRDLLMGSAGGDYLSGGGGKDKIAGYGGHDRIRGGTGDDRLDGGESDDTVFGDDGNDRIAGHQGNDVLRGGAGDDNFFVAEYYFLETDHDLMDGGAGTDTATVESDEDELISIETVI